MALQPRVSQQLPQLRKPHLQAALLAINAAQGELGDVIERGAADLPQGATGSQVAQQLTSLIERIMQLPAPATEEDRQMRLQTLLLLRDLGPSLIQHRVRQGTAAQVSTTPGRDDVVLVPVAFWQESLIVFLSIAKFSCAQLLLPVRCSACHPAAAS